MKSTKKKISDDLLDKLGEKPKRTTNFKINNVMILYAKGSVKKEDLHVSME